MSSILDKKEKKEDEVLDSALRPQKWSDYVGQDKVKENIRIIIQAAKKRSQSPDHLLLYGSSGLGKTTLAHIIAKEMGVNIRVTSGPAIERAGDLAAILTNLEPGDILFIDEIHRLNKIIEEVLYPAMEDYALDIVIGKGPSARTLRLDLPKFTIIGATTRYNLLSSPLRDRFGATYRLDYYNFPEIEQILKRSSKILSIDLIEEAAKLLTPTTELVQSIMQDNDSIHEVVNIQRTLQILTELPGPLQINLNYINEMLAWQEQFINIFVAVFNKIPYLKSKEEKVFYNGQVSDLFEKILRNKEFGFQDEDIISEAQISHIVGLNESLASGFLFHFTLEEELKKVDFETIKPRISQNRLQEDAVIRENVFKIRRGVERAYDINMRMVNLALVMYSYVKWLTSSSLNK